MKNSPLAAEVPGRESPGAYIVPSGAPGALWGLGHIYSRRHIWTDQIEFCEYRARGQKSHFPEAEKIPREYGLSQDCFYFFYL